MNRNHTFAASLLILTFALAAQGQETLSIRTETFDTSTGFLSFPVGVRGFGFDIGWRDSNHAGGEAPGEYGGTFARDSSPFHYWADKEIGDFTRRDELEVTGKFVITEDINMNGWIHVGYINTFAEAFEHQNELGMTITGPSSGGTLFRVSAASQDVRPGVRLFDNAPGRVAIGEKASFRFVWMPSATRDGTGTATLTVTLDSGGEFVSIVEDRRIPSEVEMEFDAFIIGGSVSATVDPNRRMIAFFDDISYTVKGIAEPVSDLFEGDSLGDDWYFSDWYGTYNTADFPWVFHLLHRYQYAVEAGDPGDVFLWDNEAKGWWFSGRALYPNIYSFDRSSWIFFLADTSSAGDRRFVDLGTGEFFAVP